MRTMFKQVPGAMDLGPANAIVDFSFRFASASAPHWLLPCQSLQEICYLPLKSAVRRATTYSEQHHSCA
jgi:hypothetical protein